MGKNNETVSGSCLCGAVSFRIDGPMRGVVACYCGQCQRTHGIFGAYSRCALENFSFTEERGLKWYKSSDAAERGFCAECGSSLFWKPIGGDYVSVAAGSVDDKSRLHLAGHIYCDNLPDYLSLNDDLPKYPGSSGDAFDNA